MVDIVNENAIEWLRNDKVATITACSSSKLNNNLRKLAEQYPTEVQIVCDNEDGSVMAHVPVSYISVRHPKVLSEETKKALGERLAAQRKVE